MLGRIGITQTMKTQLIAKLVSYKIILVLELLFLRQKTIITSETSDFPCIDRMKINVRTIKTNNDTSTKTKTEINNISRPLSIIQPDTNIHEIYKTGKQNFKSITGSTSSNTNKIEHATLDATITENNEKGILNKI
ncbi:hypothetical protein O181_000542 [Austropuccinia psidii MF-1]|uniref:Uncharacterized protein n=1 Tax=Austropuccinia psidii MF-1 TaxID=1389203 RepID=A0A9Q3GC63_9BASI|nr:hypothetical protein [Austropuccinia psidii MF-1]